MVAVLAAALGDEPVDGAVELFLRRVESQVFGRGQPAQDIPERQEHPVEIFNDDGERLRNVAGLGIDFRTKKRRRDHGQRQPVHLDREIDFPVRALGIGPIPRLCGHDSRVTGNTSAMKRRLDQPPLARVLLAFADEQAVAEEDARALQRLALAKEILLGDKDLVHQRRIAEEDEALVKNVEARNVAVFLLELAKKFERAAEPPVRAARDRILARLGDGLKRTRRHEPDISRRNKKAKAGLWAIHSYLDNDDAMRPYRGLPSACLR